MTLDLSNYGWINVKTWWNSGWLINSINVLLCKKYTWRSDDVLWGGKISRNLVLPYDFECKVPVLTVSYSLGFLSLHFGN